MNILCLLLVLLSVSLIASPSASAQVMENNGYILELEDVDHQTQLSPTPTPPISARPTRSNSNNNNQTIPIFPLETPRYTLSLSLSTDRIDYGILTPTSPTERLLTVSLTGTTDEFILYTLENHTLENQQNNHIPKTSCDNGNCSEHIASVWDSTLSFGLGYSCEAEVCDEDFTNNRFRPFPTNLTSFAKGKLGTGRKQVIKLPLRVTVPGTQERGNYEHAITILAVPSL